MRRGKVLGLDWTKVWLDQTSPTLAVLRVLVQVKDELIFKPPKTKKARRLITLTEDAIEGLRRHRVR